MSKFLIPLPDYNRIHQVAHGVLKDIGTPEKGCTFFAIFGSYILNQHYGIDARPVAGGFSMCIADEKCLIYGRNEGGEYVVDSDGFHMWVQTRTHVIDFTAPIYPEAFAEAEPDVAMPRKMFQRRIDEGKDSLTDVVSVGDFLAHPDPALTNEIIQRFLGRPVNTDLIQVAEHWFGNRRAKQQQHNQMMNEKGEVISLRLPPFAANA